MFPHVYARPKADLDTRGETEANCLARRVSMMGIVWLDEM